MIRLIETRRAGDTVGGVIEAWRAACPPGWGEPVFDKLEADLAKAMLSLPASKGFEIGSGFAGTVLTGREHNDPFVHRGADGAHATNRSGGIQGGISNGEPIIVPRRVQADRPPSCSAGHRGPEGATRPCKAQGRHDPCVLPRAVPMVEAMTALVLGDHCLRQRATAPPADGFSQ